MTLIHPASKNARTPISSFKVGAVGLGGSGNIYVGVNLELHGLPLYNSVHAEQFLIVNAIRCADQSMPRPSSRVPLIASGPAGHSSSLLTYRMLTACGSAPSLSFSFPNAPQRAPRAPQQRRDVPPNDGHIGRPVRALPPVLL